MATEIRSGQTPPLWDGGFATTHWNTVLAARGDDSVLAAAALEKLCAAYWPPLYAFVRRAGHRPEEAQDLTQEFLCRLVHRDWLQRLDEQRGRFRSFLLAYLKHFLADQRDRSRAEKRGGRHVIVSLDAFTAEERARVEPAQHETAEQVFEHRWAEAIMAEAVRQLAAEYRRRGSEAIFDVLKDLPAGEHGPQRYAEIGARLGLTEQAVENAVLRFRRRFAELVRATIAHTVADPAEVEEELRHLKRVFAG